MGAAHMDENERRAQDENVDYKVSTPDYGELIIEMVHKMDKTDDKFLRQIYIIMHRHIKKEG